MCFIYRKLQFCFFRIWLRGFKAGDILFFVHDVGIVLISCHFSDDLNHLFNSFGEDVGIMQLNIPGSCIGLAELILPDKYGSSHSATRHHSPNQKKFVAMHHIIRVVTEIKLYSSL
jgi:hypothetical protein